MSQSRWVVATAVTVVAFTLTWSHIAQPLTFIFDAQAIYTHTHIISILFDFLVNSRISHTYLIRSSIQVNTIQINDIPYFKMHKLFTRKSIKKLFLSKIVLNRKNKIESKDVK